MRRLGGVLLIVAGVAVSVIGVLTGIQIHSPFLQKSLFILLTVAIGYGLLRLGRRLMQKR